MGRRRRAKAAGSSTKKGGKKDKDKTKVVDLPPKPSDIDALSPKIRNLFKPLQPSKKKLENKDKEQKRKFAHITPIPGESLKSFYRRVNQEFLKVRVQERVAAGPLKQTSEKRKEFLEEKAKKKKKKVESDASDDDDASVVNEKGAVPASASQTVGPIRAASVKLNDKLQAEQVGALVDTFGRHIEHYHPSLQPLTGKKRERDSWKEDFPQPEKISFLERAEAPPTIKSVPKYSRSKKAAIAAATGLQPDNTGRAESDAARRRREQKEKEDAETARLAMVEEARREKAKEDALAAYALMKKRRMDAIRAAAVSAGSQAGKGVVGALRLGNL